MTDLNEMLGADDVERLTRSWLAFSATNIIFRRNGDLLLGVRAKPAEAIPEPGDLMLIGGFNTEVPGPAMFADVANAHAKTQIGITLWPNQCSHFRHCEYDMTAITDPLNTPFGKVPIKRVAFSRIVILDKGQDAEVRPSGKLKDVQWTSEGAFNDLVKDHREKLSFVHQIGQVENAFMNAYDFLFRTRSYKISDMWA